MNKWNELFARVFLALIFLMGGIGKLGAGYAGTQAYMEAFGLPGILLPLVIALELGGAIALMLGFFTRYTAWALAVFSLVAAVIFHREFGDQTQAIMFFKNLAIAGGLMLVAGHGAGALSWDAKRNKH